MGHLTVPGTLTRRFERFLNVPAAELVGCSKTEIAEAEAVARRPLPVAYTNFLREAGKRVGHGRVADHFTRSYLLYPDLLEVRDIAAEVIRHVGADQSLLDRSFPFLNWEVYHICLLDLSEGGHDPPVLVLSEITGTAQREFGSFSHFMGWEILALADAIR